MPISELRRGRATEFDTYDLVAVLALKAEAVLGYSWLRKKLNIEQKSLARVLEELGIEPFRPEDVKHYKKSRARAERHRILADFRERSERDRFIGLAPGTYVRVKWRTVPLRNFDGEVPEFALSHALEIKERMPNADFHVDQLKIDERYDPFLIVSCGRERFYIDVWDEDDFEKGLVSTD